MNGTNQQKIGALIIGGLILIVAFADRMGLGPTQYVQESFFAVEMPVSEQTFRGLSWGEHAENDPGFSLPVEQLEGVNYYVRKDEKLRIGDAAVNEIQYGFYGGQFKEAYVYFGGKTNFEVLLKGLTARYGNPVQDDPEIDTYFWLRIPTTIMLVYDHDSNEGDVSYFYEPEILGGEKGRKNLALSENDEL